MGRLLAVEVALASGEGPGQVLAEVAPEALEAQAEVVNQSLSNNQDTLIERPEPVDEAVSLLFLLKECAKLHHPTRVHLLQLPYAMTLTRLLLLFLLQLSLLLGPCFIFLLITHSFS